MSKIILMGDSLIEYLPHFIDKGISSYFGTTLTKGIIGTEEDEVKVCGIENRGVGTYYKYDWPNVSEKEKDVDFYILQIGINNLLRPDCDYDQIDTLDDTMTKLANLIKDISKKENSTLIVQSLYPNNKARVQKDIIKVNEFLSKLCNEIDIKYLNLYPLLVDENHCMKKEYTYDGLHPNELGYSIIVDEINKYLSNLLEEDKKKVKKISKLYKI